MTNSPKFIKTKVSGWQKFIFWLRRPFCRHKRTFIISFEQGCVVYRCIDCDQIINKKVKM